MPLIQVAIPNIEPHVTRRTIATLQRSEAINVESSQLATLI